MLKSRSAVVLESCRDGELESWRAGVVESLARQGKASQGRTKQGRSRQGKAGRDEASQGKARQGRAGQGKARQGKARQGMCGHVWGKNQREGASIR